MSSENETTIYTESPASWNTRYITHDGFSCQLTLRAESGKELLEKATSAMEYLREQGCIPVYGYSKGNSDYQERESKSEQQSDKSTNGNSSWCPIHEINMKLWQKNGKAWYSHKTDEGWCCGKPKNGKKD
jgi:hypothetical protein